MSSPRPDLRTGPPPVSWGVEIDHDAVRATAEELAGHRFEPASYEYEGTPDLEGEDWGRFVVLGVSVVWRLWPPEGESMWTVTVGDEVYDDAPGLWTCFRRDPRSLDLRAVASGGLGHEFFAGSGVLQDVPRRLELLGDVANALVDQHDGSVLGMIERSGGDAVGLRDMLVETVPGYHDRPASPVGILEFDKLANLAVTMLAARLPIVGTERFPVFPDYMLPRHLRHRGILRYAEDLAEAVDSRKILAPGSPAEMGIRWATIHAAELLRSELRAVGNPVATPDLDYWLWWEAVIGPEADSMGEHHLCVTEAY